jgi:hypothetical protein
MANLNLPLPPSPTSPQYSGKYQQYENALYQILLTWRGLLQTTTQANLQAISLIGIENAEVPIGVVNTINLGAGLEWTLAGNIGTISFSGSPTFYDFSVTNNITAAGSTQGTATALSTQINGVTTVAANQGVLLPVVSAGTWIRVLNRGANTLKVYPPSGGNIEGLSANVASSLAVNGGNDYNYMGSGQWYVS